MTFHLHNLREFVQMSYFCVALCIFVIGDRKDSKFDVQVEYTSHSLRRTNCL